MRVFYLQRHDTGKEEDDSCEVFRDVFGTRFAVSCEEFVTELQANIAEDHHPEPKLDNVSTARINAGFSLVREIPGSNP